MSLIESSLQADFSAHEYVSECQDFIEWNITYLFNMFVSLFTGDSWFYNDSRMNVKECLEKAIAHST